MTSDHITEQLWMPWTRPLTPILTEPQTLEDQTSLSTSCVGPSDSDGPAVGSVCTDKDLASSEHNYFYELGPFHSIPLNHTVGQGPLEEFLTEVK